MVEKFNPEINKVYFINQYTLFHILSGSGSIQVDFKNYYDWGDKVIYLEKGQYIKFVSDDFYVRKIEFPNEEVFRNKEVRVLFKHLVSLGYINFNDCADCKKYLSNMVFSENTAAIIDASSKQWYWQNPFNADRSEYQVIFDIKEVVDAQYAHNLTSEELVGLINENASQAQALVKDKIGLSIKSLLSEKRLVQSKKEIVFTDKNIQEISYDMGYKDPAYFSRVFKNNTGQTPAQFRMEFDYPNRDTFVQNIVELLREHHAEQRSLAFYAHKMNLSVKALSKKTRDKMNASLGQLVRLELVNTSKTMLGDDAVVQDVALKLGFEEPNHFSHFFKHHVGVSPSDFKNQKVQFLAPFS